MINTEILVQIAREASEKILEIYNSDDFEVQIKEDKSPLTKADTASNDHITAELEKHFEYPVLSEECPIDYEQRKNWNRFWLVDPLDGTKDFIAKNDSFTVNIALIEGHRPVYGLIAIPATGEIYYATDKLGAFKIENGEIRKIFYKQRNEGLSCTDSNFHSTPKVVELCEKLGITDIRKYGSAIKLGKVAEGEVDIYPRYAPTMEWDTAAGHCILNESGCKLIDMVTKTDMVYNRENLKNNGFIACPVDKDYFNYL